MTTATSRTDVNRNREETSDPQHASFRDVKEDVNRLKQDASKCASDVADSSLAVARSGAAHAMESGRKVADSLKETHERVCDYVTANPTTSILIAAGVGALLARFLPRG